MCSINGFVAFKKSNFTVVEKIQDIIIRGEQRGKDSFGYVEFGSDGTHIHKYIDKPSSVLPAGIELNNADDSIKILLNNNRAEPTTEFIDRKTLCDVQPFNYNSWWVVHNGTVANDKEIKLQYKIDFDSEIDSYVIPYMLNKKYDGTHESVLNCLRDDILGSYALAAYKEGSKYIYLATNYKPLYILYDKNTDVLYFSSIENYLKIDDYNFVYGASNVMEVKPYTMLAININSGEIESFSLYKEKRRTKALICASSGMDSTVAATWAKNQGYDIALLHFEYHCRAEQRERESIERIAKYLDAELVTIKTDFFRDVIKGSRLTGDGDIIKEGDAGAELAYEWVPARNLIFMSIAAGYAEAHNIDYIVLGGNLEESGAYADNELIFQTKFNDILPNALNLQNRVEVLTPVANLMKRDIVKLGLDINAPLHLTWSCYENGDKHCGKCGPCFMRKTAFKMLKQPEVIEYYD